MATNQSNKKLPKRSPRFLLLMPEDVRHEIERSATAFGRTVTSEINLRLRESIKPAPVVAAEAGHQDATRPVTEPRQYSEFGLALAGLYDDLPNNSRLRAALWGKVSALLLEPTRPPGSPQAGVPAPAATPKKPHA